MIDELTPTYCMANAHQQIDELARLRNEKKWAAAEKLAQKIAAGMLTVAHHCSLKGNE